MLIVVGPVDAASARAWTGHLLAALEVVRAERHLLPFRLPDEVAHDFERFLRTWADIARDADVFFWEADLDPDQVRSLVRYWANLDSLGDDWVDGVGLAWSPMAARPFFDALTSGVADALSREGEPDPFADLLVDRGRQQVLDASGGPERPRG